MTHVQTFITVSVRERSETRKPGIDRVSLLSITTGETGKQSASKQRYDIPLAGHTEPCCLLVRSGFWKPPKERFKLNLCTPLDLFEKVPLRRRQAIRPSR